MKIIHLKAENIKRLIAVDISPDKNVVKITGKNGHGKTSVLDSIWWCLGGAQNIQSRPVNDSADEGFVEIDLGDMVVTRKFKKQDGGKYTSSLKIESKDGAVFKSPQSLIDKLLGDLTFDPMAFQRLDPKKQFEILKSFVPDVDFEKIEDENKKDYDERTDLNRQYKEKKSAADQIDVDIQSAPTDIIDTSKMMKQIEVASEHNSKVSSCRSDRAQKIKRMEQLKSELKQLEEEIKAQIDDPVDIQDLSKKVEEAQKHNEIVRNKHEKVKLIETASLLKQQADELTKRIEKRNEDKKRSIENAKLPVNGIGFGDGEVLLNGLPLCQASDAEQLRASLSIAMALNPELRVIRVRDGSLLDDDSMKIVEEMAEKNDFQIWIEIVDGSGKVGFVLEEGSLKGSPEGINEF